ncbi:SDR family NAD(P)-dependent oxidoreductase [Sandaracinomonas limnophila]|uniref:SDR family NAD(P)-dependent oxidoreductase n=1 Tax=Sandaracinomonas limnophila TaxID=1862386 RepID=A0A437PRX1_9BACT|nr:SDR family NAD(P)-dependent oxidoreductase [Sandaracinomonas limnophila]RVU24980.1 SDR family NAD(P)-dependent oxidoreductase [Sandaracinomonas limnophila]
MTIKKNTVWITGASSGIGEALAYAYARENANLILSARREEELNRVAELCRTSQNKVLVLPFDMVDLEYHSTALEIIGKEFDQIDLVYLNAGVSQRSSILDTDFSVYRKLFEINFFSIVHLVQKLIPVFQKQGFGTFVPIASVAGRISTPRRGAYAASKHAIIGFFDALRAEMYPLGIRVCTILPGYIKTNISIAAMDATGGKYGKMDPNQAKGLDVNWTAEEIKKAVSAGLNEKIIAGKKEKLGLFIHRFFPKLLPFVLRKVHNS